MAPPGDDPIKLIEVAAALADDQPRTDLSAFGLPSSKYGYWFRALRYADEAVPDPVRFAACARPAAYGGWTRLTLIVDERGRIYQKDLGHGLGIAAFPGDPWAEGWERR